MKTVTKLSCVVAFAMGVGCAQACDNNTIELEAEQILAVSAQQIKADIRNAVAGDLNQEWLLASPQSKEVMTAKSTTTENTSDDDA